METCLTGGSICAFGQLSSYHSSLDPLAHLTHFQNFVSLLFKSIPISIGVQIITYLIFVGVEKVGKSNNQIQTKWIIGWNSFYLLTYHQKLPGRNDSITYFTSCKSRMLIQ